MQLKRSQAAGESGFDRVFGFIRQQLVAGELRAGDVLAPERELATRLGVSRPVVREALRALAGIGVIDIRHGYGSVVRKPDFAELSDIFTLMLAQHEEGIDDIMEARIAIERQAIRLACRRANPADIERLREALEEIKTTVRDPTSGAAADFRFHSFLIAAAHSVTLTTLYAAIEVLLRRSHYARRARISELPDIEAYLVAHHREILDAVVERDEAKADALLTAHFAIGSDLQRQSVMANRVLPD